MGKDRILIFSDPGSPAAAALTDAFLAAAAKRSDVEWIGVCDASPKLPKSPFQLAIHEFGRRGAERVFGPPSLIKRSGLAAWQDVRAVTRRRGVELIEPPERNINHPDFLAALKTRWKPTVALSLICFQIFRSDLLACFEYSLNFHDGLLPGYKGLFATPWSIYRGESHSGYSFHGINLKIDAGPVVFEGQTALRSDSTLGEILSWKTLDATSHAEEVLDLVAARSPGAPQSGPGHFFRAKDGFALRAIDDPRQLSCEEIVLRLRSFGRLQIKIEGRNAEVTALKRVNGRKPGYAMKTSDGELLEPYRFHYLPASLYRAYQMVRRGRG